MHLIPVLQWFLPKNFPTPSVLLYSLTLVVQFPFCTVSLCKALCFAAGAWAVVLGTGILVLSTSLHNFFCSTICSKIKLRSSLPRSFLPPLGSHTRFSKQYVKGLSSGCLCIMQMRQGLSREITACIETTEIYILLYVSLYIFIYIK